jgi:DNA recombination protein RmuC
MLVAAALAGVLIGALLSWMQGRSALTLSKTAADSAAARAMEAQARVERLEGEMQALRTQEAASKQEAQARVERLEGELQTLRAQESASKQEAAVLRNQLEGERALAAERLQAMEQAKQAMTHEFKTLAQAIFEEKGKRFAEQNSEQISGLLNPLRQRLGEFTQRIDEVHRSDVEQHAALKSELNQIRDINAAMTREAHELATALKGQVKMQGNWGELVLANVLERSGLREGEDYRLQPSIQTEEGRRQPDAIVRLPQNRHLIIDSKVSLNAYTRYVNASDEAQRALALREHAQAVRGRIAELSEKHYFQLPGINSPDLVFLFIPIESAFIEAMRGDEELFQEAIGKNVLVTTPTTLLTSLKMVRQLWFYEQRNKHMQELAQSASKVHAKLCGFVETLQSAGAQLDRARASFDQAMNQLCQGRGNLVRLASRFEELGVSVTHTLPAELVDRAMQEVSPQRAAAALEQEASQSHSAAAEHPLLEGEETMESEGLL